MIIVYTSVCGDILHYGHLRYLESAKALGDILIVGVLTDEAIMKEKPCPVISFIERLALIQALRCVDLAIPQEAYAPHDNARWLKADILVGSTSHSDEMLACGEFLMESLGGRMIVLPYYPDKSSTKIKERINEST